MSASFRDRLRAGGPLIGTLLGLPSPELAEIAAAAGFDWLFLDTEHGALGPGDVLRVLQAVPESCAVLVRVPELRETWIQKALDAGAAGVIIPHVDDASAAARAVHWAKYPPEGGRSVGFTRAGGYGARFQENVETANARTVVVAQVEHIDGVTDIEAILDVGGLDAVFVGPYDLSASLGMPGAVQAPEVRAALETVAAACARRKVPSGVFAADAAGAAAALAAGFTLVCAGLDVGLYARAAGEIVRALRPTSP